MKKPDRKILTRAAIPAGLLLAALLPLFLSGCLATQQDVQNLESQVDELKGQLANLNKPVSDLQANQADLSSQMSQLHDDLKSFTATIQDSQAQMTRLSAKLDDMDAQVATMGAQVTTKVASIGSALTSEQALSVKEQKEALAKQEAALLNQTSPTALFDAANARLAVESYGLAAKGFSQYLKEFPNGALADIVLYKLGEAYYGMGDWKDAGEQFALVLEKYPKNDLTASSRLMYALCLIHMEKNLKEAQEYLESILSDFPDRPEANAAKLELKRLKKLASHKEKAKPSAPAAQ